MCATAGPCPAVPLSGLRQHWCRVASFASPGFFKQPWLRIPRGKAPPGLCRLSPGSFEPRAMVRRTAQHRIHASLARRLAFRRTISGVFTTAAGRAFEAGPRPASSASSLHRAVVPGGGAPQQPGCRLTRPARGRRSLPVLRHVSGRRPRGKDHRNLFIDCGKIMARIERPAPICRCSRAAADQKPG